VSLYEISVVKTLRSGERKHTVVYYHVVAASTLEAETKLREYMEDRIDRYEHVSAAREVGDIQTNSYSTCTPEELLKRQGKPLPEKNVLRALRDHQGRWHSSCGWYWSTDSGTRRILETLVQRCLVDKEGEGYRATYTINRSGLEALKQGRLI
jgi:hypothetical protein